MALKKKSIFQETNIVKRMKDRNRPVRALINGVATIRNQITNKNNETEPTIVEYIPKEERESKKAYENRLLRTYVTPYLKNAVTTATGQIFKNPIQIRPENEALPEQVNDLIKNVDMEGTDLNEFCMKATEESLAYGMSIAYVDYANPSKSDNRGEQMQSGARPYVKLVTYYDLLGYSFDQYGRITMLRFLEEAILEDEEYGVETAQRVKVVTPTGYKIYDQDEKGEDYLVEQGKIQRFVDGKLIKDYVPAVVLYGRKLGTLNAASVFEDLAYINLQHTQVNSDLSWSAHFYLIPFLFTIMGEDGDTEEFSKNFSLLASNINVTLPKDSDIKWVETNGKAQEAGQSLLNSIEEKIDISKMDSTVSVTSGAKETATGRALQADSSSAKLKLHAEAIESFAKSIIEMMASFTVYKLPSFDVLANKEFNAKFNDSVFKTTTDMVSNNQLTLKTMLSEAQRRGDISDDIDIDKEVEELMKAGKKEDGPDIITQDNNIELEEEEYDELEQ